MTKDNQEPIEEVQLETPGAEETPTGGEEQPKETAAYTLPNDKSIPEKFRGKDPSEVVKSYVELEKMIGRKAEDLANEMLQERGISPNQEQKEEIKEVAEEIDFSKLDFKQMSPQDFAKWIMGEVDKRAEAKARSIYQNTTQTQEQMRREISTAQEKHPQLKTNQAYKEAVVAQISFAQGQGKRMTLEEACTKVDELIGVQASETPATPTQPEVPAKPNPVKRAGVESTKPTDPGNNMSEEDAVKQGMLNAGGKNKGVLGGLGI